MEIEGPWACVPLAALFLWMALAPKGWTEFSNALGRRGSPLGTRVLGIGGTVFCALIWLAFVIHDGGIRPPVIIHR